MTELTAQEWIDKYGVENALANLAPYHENEMLFIIPRDKLDEVKVLVKKSSTENKDLK